jgi:DNA-binding NarL/FixJ family response regulator
MPEESFRILVVSARPSVRAFFAAIAGRKAAGVSNTVLDHSREAVARSPRAVAEASVAIVDGSIDASESLKVCEALRAQREDLRIGILFCCPGAVSLERLRLFLAIEIGSFLDLQLSSEQTLAAVRGIARGEVVVRLQLSEDSSSALFNGQEQTVSSADLSLLHLVSLGLTDQEIGVEMCLSRHTIKHRIERLRQRHHARNRVQLAAVAGRLEGSRGGLR